MKRVFRALGRRVIVLCDLYDLYDPIGFHGERRTRHVADGPRTAVTPNAKRH